MPNYIWSSANRFYAALESSYGVATPIAPANRFQAARLRCHQLLQSTRRRDKTGARTFMGSPVTAARTSNFEVTTYLTSWDQATAPSIAPLIQSAMGAVPHLVSGLTVATASGGQIQTQSPHNLSIGSAISSGGEIRFVTAVPDSSTVNISAPFSLTPTAQALLDTTIGFKLSTQLSSLSLYDYWDPANGVSRLITGAGIDKFQIVVQGDTHELQFSGPACDVLDSCSGAFGLSGIGTFPPEPALSAFNYSIVPGQLGQVWLGMPLAQVFTLTEASVQIGNNIVTRSHEFGLSFARAIVPGDREVISSFTLFAQDDTNTRNLYAAAKNRAAISATLQFGQQPGQMMAVYLPAVVPELPLFNDSEPNLLWEFKNNLGQGVSNDEVYIAFA